MYYVCLNLYNIILGIRLGFLLSHIILNWGVCVDLTKFIDIMGIYPPKNFMQLKYFLGNIG